MDVSIQNGEKAKLSGSIKRTFETIGGDVNSIPFQVSNAASSPIVSSEEHVPKRRKVEDGKTGIKRGRWDKYEHSLFVKGLQIYGRQWKLIAEMIKTRTAVQIRSHAQKYFNKLEKLQHQRLIGMVANNAGAQSAQFLQPPQSANPYLQSNFAAMAQVQMMMQGGQIPQLYPAQTVCAPQLAAFKALYARNQGGIATPTTTLDTKTQVPKTAGKNATPPITTPPTTLLPPTVHPATLPGPSIPSGTVPVMSPYQFPTAQVPYVPMNHPLVLAAIQRQQIQQQHIQQQQNLLKFQKQTSNVVSPVVPTPTTTTTSQQSSSVHQDVKIDKVGGESKSASENQVILKHKVLDSRASPTVGVNGTSSPTRAKRVEITKPVSDGEEELDEKKKKSEDQSLSVLASLASSNDDEKKN